MLVNRPFLLAFASGCIVLAAFAGSAHSSSYRPPVQQVLKVDEVSAKFEKGILTITASGAVATGGWNTPSLRIKENRRDVMVLDFVAQPPATDALVIQAIVPVRARLATGSPGPRITSVRVDSQSNSLSTTIEIKHP